MQTENNKTETTPEEGQFNSSDFFKEHLHRSEDGKYEIQGEDLAPVELALLETEVRRRGSQAAVTKEQMRANRVEIELNKVKEVIPTVDTQRKVVDEALKYTDPDEYIRLSLEAKQATDPYTDAFATASRYAEEQVGQMTLEGVIAAHNEAHPDRAITEGMLELDLPPRLVREFSNGKLSPSDFLDQASTILYRPTEIANQELPSMPDLGAVSGQTTPTDDGQNDTLMANYASAVI